LPDAVLDPSLRATLDAVLDELIPPSKDARLPGAGQAGSGASVALALAANLESLPMIEQALAALDERARAAGAVGFAALDRAGRLEALEANVEAHPALIPSLVYHTYSAYYREPLVARKLGFEARPPHPVGYEMEPNDFSLLDPVKKRPKFYRE
jgi:hypothetical protein